MYSSNKINITIGAKILSASLVDNSSTRALLQMLQKGPIKVNMRDYGNMEKVGMLKRCLPANDEQITTEPGDLILYKRLAFVIYYESNTWNFTRLGKINNISKPELKSLLGDGNISITLSLPQ